MVVTSLNHTLKPLHNSLKHIFSYSKAGICNQPFQPTSTHEENLVHIRRTQLFKGEYSGSDVPHEPVNPGH